MPDPSSAPRALDLRDRVLVRVRSLEQADLVALLTDVWDGLLTEAQRSALAAALQVQED